MFFQGIFEANPFLDVIRKGVDRVLEVKAYHDRGLHFLVRKNCLVRISQQEVTWEKFK